MLDADTTNELRAIFMDYEKQHPVLHQELTRKRHDAWFRDLAGSMIVPALKELKELAADYKHGFDYGFAQKDGTSALSVTLKPAQWVSIYAVPTLTFFSEAGTNIIGVKLGGTAPLPFAKESLAPFNVSDWDPSEAGDFLKEFVRLVLTVR